MLRISRFIFDLGLLVSLLFGPSAHAETWEDLADQADSLSKVGNFDSAVVIAKVALKKAEMQFGGSDTIVATLLSVCGYLSRRQARYAEAEQFYKRALEIREETMGRDHLKAGTSLNSLATLYRNQGRYAEAKPLYERALRIREEALGPHHPDVATSLNGFAVLHYMQGRYAEAELLYKRALKIWEEAFGLDHPDVAVSLNNLGGLYYTEGRYADAEPLYKRALKIWEEALGPDHPKVAASLDNLGALCYAQGRYADAEPHLTQALKIREKALGPDHPDVAGSLNNLGFLQRTQGRYAEAELHLRRAVDVWEKVLGPHHPDLAMSLNNLGILYHDQGRYADAEPLYKRALEIKEEALGPHHPDVAASLNSLGSLYDDQGRYADAEPLYRLALEIREKALGAHHPDLAISLNGLGILYHKQGRYAEAELLYKRALKIWEEALGPDHPDVAAMLNCLGTLYREQMRYVQAEPLLKQALEIKEEALGPHHPEVASCLSALGKLHIDQGRWHDSRATERRAYHIRRKNFRDGVEVLSEKNALLYSKFMTDQAGTYLSILHDSADASARCTEEIADVVFSSKGQVSDGIFARQRAFFQETDSSLKSLVDSLRLARVTLARLYVRGPDEDDPASYKDELTMASAEKEQLESELARRSASFRRELEVWQVDSRKVSQCLPTGSILVEFMKYNCIRPQGIKPQEETEPHYLVVVVNSENEVSTLDLGRAAKIDSSVSWYRSHFQVPSMINEKDYKRISDEIYQLVWKPTEDELGQPEMVFIAPDGPLNLVSFSGLMDDSGNYLIEKFPIHYLSSGRDLLRLKERPPCGSGLLALGDPDYDAPPSARLSARPVQAGDTLLASAFPIVRNVRSGCKELSDMRVSRLPRTRHEVELLSKSWKKEKKEPIRVYFGPQASEETFKAEAPGSRVIHLATHGYFVSPEYLQRPQRRGIDPSESFVGENPLLLSGLFLSGANLHGKEADSLACEDGILAAEEVAGMDLEGTELVVLSACETGLGEVKLGEGVYGLRRAFQMAGARTVISALWPVSDEATAELMGRLYGSGRGNIPQIMQKMAVRRIRELRKKGQSDHPFSWGAFIALGDWRIE